MTDRNKTLPMPQLLTVADVMESLRVSRRHVERLIERGELETKRIGGRWIRITKESFDRHYESL